MKVARLGWMGVKTRQFDQMNALYRDVIAPDGNVYEIIGNDVAA